MDIAFPVEAPVYRAFEVSVAFPAVVDGKRLECAISAEALEDHFGAPSLSAADLIAAFDAHRDPIQRAARRMLEAIGAKPVCLHSGYFRFCS
jgi:hypothetical protein